MTDISGKIRRVRTAEFVLLYFEAHKILLEDMERINCRFINSEIATIEDYLEQVKNLLGMQGVTNSHQEKQMATREA